MEDFFKDTKNCNIEHAMKYTPPQDRQQIAHVGAQLLRKCGANTQAAEILKAAETRWTVRMQIVLSELEMAL